MIKKIAFIHHSRFPSSTRLETMAFSLNSVISLANIGWEIDLYLWEKPLPIYQKLLPKNVNIKYFEEPVSQFMRGLRPILFRLQFQRWNNYYCVFGVGQIAAYIADIIAKANRCPFIYFNDEFPSGWGPNRWTKLEQKAVKNASMIVVPDPHRFPPLCKELDVSQKPHAFLPNMPMLKPIIEEINWNKRLGLAEDAVPFLYAGNVMANWTQIPEMLSSLPYWNEKAVLILHGDFLQEVDEFRKMMSHLDVSDKIIWSDEALEVDELHSLIAYCAGNLALYRNTQINMEYLGFASGKIMRSIVCGSPIIASEGFYFDFIRDYQLGVLVKHPCEIPAAIEEITHHREAYRQRCLDFCKQEISFEKTWKNFCEQLKQTLDLDLLNPLI